MRDDGQVVVRDGGIYKRGELVGHFGQTDGESGMWRVSIRIDKLTGAPEIGRYIGDEFLTEAAARAWLEKRKDMIDTFTRPPVSATRLPDLILALDELNREAGESEESS